MRGRFIFPLDGEDDVAIGSGTTESDDPQENARWAAAQQPGAYQLPAGARANIVVALDTVTPDAGAARALRVTYSVDTKRYSVDTTTALVLSTTSCL
ncbi:hypothetical protein PTW37_08915 [Arthrobacter agilis]|uniref:hypothetical protein n=1 Tax=Arthrobacter agilis TaxID=37921 RepID=UPI0023665702|nr:hypothetical protein [Arthrobacter agilis]WDF32012.1 hypothetical protein PTW37_08915 [Arthrobacter agilis]